MNARSDTENLFTLTWQTETIHLNPQCLRILRIPMSHQVNVTLVQCTLTNNSTICFFCYKYIHTYTHYEHLFYVAAVQCFGWRKRYIQLNVLRWQHSAHHGAMLMKVIVGKCNKNFWFERRACIAQSHTDNATLVRSADAMRFATTLHRECNCSWQMMRPENEINIKGPCGLVSECVSRLTLTWRHGRLDLHVVCLYLYRNTAVTSWGNDFIIFIIEIQRTQKELTQRSNYSAWMIRALCDLHQRTVHWPQTNGQANDGTNKWTNEEYNEYWLWADFLCLVVCWAVLHVYYILLLLHSADPVWGKKPKCL